MNHEQPPDANRAEQTPPVEPHIWVVSATDLDEGISHGTWLPASREAHALQTDIDAMLAASPTAARTGLPVERWSILDQRGFGSFHLAQHEELAIVSLVGRGIEQHGLAFAGYADVMDGDPELIAGFTDDYLGHYADLDSYGRHLVVQRGYAQQLDALVPAAWRRYVQIDGSALSHDLHMSGDIHYLPADDDGVWIFQTR